MIAAIDSGRLEYVKKLLELGANPNLEPENGETPAQVAVKKGGLHILEVLVQHGAQLSYKDRVGRGVLSHAIVWKSVDLISYLWTRPEIDIDEQDLSGQTPLMQAAIQGSDVVEELLARKAQADMQDQWEKTALIHAVSRDYPYIVSKLLDAGANPLTRDVRGRDALYWAARGSSPETFDLILKAMQTRRAAQSRFQLAINAAAAANRADFVEKLLGQIHYDHELADEDNWRPAYAAMRYNRASILSLIHDAAGSHTITAREAKSPHESRRQETTPPTKIPTGWHPLDHSTPLLRQPDARSITVGSA